MVVTAWPSAWAAKTVQDLTAIPSRWTVQAPHWLVSQPTWVPVSPAQRRTNSTSSILGSTSCGVLASVDFERHPDHAAASSSACHTASGV